MDALSGPTLHSEPSSPPAPTRRPRLLVVDDVATNRDLLRLQLTRYGYDVQTASSGVETLALVASTHFDLVLLDIRMPEMDGMEVLRLIRASHSLLALPVIMVTAEDQEQRLIEALRLGANDYLSKPLRLPVTLARIEAQLSVGRLATMQEEVLRFASHDLKKPLMVMTDVAESLQRELRTAGRLADDAGELLDLLLRSGDHMQSLIAGFLDQKLLNHAEAPPLRPLDINAVAEKSLHANAVYAEHKGIALTHDFASSLPPVRANEFRLCQVLDNLIGNALKFSPRGSCTRLCTRVEGDMVCVEVSDTGPGLREDDFANLFVKHARLSNAPTGNESSSGIGLAMCKQLVRLDEGSIGAQNNADGGATFWIRLPAG